MSFVGNARVRGRSGQVWLAACVAATLALAVWLVFQVVDSERSHRRAAQRVLTDYAGIAAREFSSAVDEDLDEFLHDVLDQRRRGNWRSETPGAMAREMGDAALERGCECPGLNTRTTYFQIDPRVGVGATLPDSVDPDLLRGLGLRIIEDYDPLSREPYGILALIALTGRDGPVVVAYSMAADTTRAHGFVADHSSIGELLTQSFEQSDILPLPVADSIPPDSLVFVSVRDPAGRILFASSTPYPLTFVARDTLGPQLGSLVIEAAIRPDAANRLVIGGLPRSRLPLLGALLALTMPVGVAALVQIRRQHELAKLREDFVSGVSHEFRTPLTQIRMFSELLEDNMIGTEEERARSINIISRESRRLSNLVENVLEFSGLRRGNSDPAPVERIGLRRAVDDVFAAFRPMADARHAALVCDVKPAEVIHASRTGLHQILTNLIDNAVKYGPEGQTIRVAATRSNGSTRLYVEDQGAGVAAVDREKVWQPYRRLDRDIDSDVQGSGLGLAVVAELASRQGGRAWVEDGTDSGARFVVELPAGAPPGDVK